jgi:hypothetical protein
MIEPLHPPQDQPKRKRRFTFGILGLVLLAVLLPLVLALLPPSMTAPIEPALVTVEAIRVLGPAAGSRCLHEPTYRYDPRHDRPDRALVAALPEEAVVAFLAQREGRAAGDISVESVEVNLRSPAARVVARVRGGADEPRLFLLGVSSARTVSMDWLPDREIMLCYARMGGWHVAEAARL